MAEPGSADPVARESTRLWCVAVNAAQTTLDPKQMREWTPNSQYGGFAFGVQADPVRKLSEFEVFLARRDSMLPWLAEFSPYALVSKDDPPTFLWYGTRPALGQEERDPAHTANFGVKLAERLGEVGVECELVYPGGPKTRFVSAADWLVERLKHP
jgi:acetyl esterase/lipase